MVFNTAGVIGDTVNRKTNIVNGTEKIVKNPSRLEAGQLVIYKTWRI